LRPRVTHFWIFREAAQYSHPQFIAASHLAGEPHILRDLIECGQFVALDVGHRSWITVQDLHSTRRTARISAATMQDIDPGGHNCQDKSLAIGRACSSDSLHLNDRHESLPSSIPIRSVDLAR
jgi:hypothetical protein